MAVHIGATCMGSKENITEKKAKEFFSKVLGTHKGLQKKLHPPELHVNEEYYWRITMGQIHYDLHRACEEHVALGIFHIFSEEFYPIGYVFYSYETCEIDLDCTRLDRSNDIKTQVAYTLLRMTKQHLGDVISDDMVDDVFFNDEDEEEHSENGVYKN